MSARYILIEVDDGYTEQTVRDVLTTGAMFGADAFRSADVTELLDGHAYMEDPS